MDGDAAGRIFRMRERVHSLADELLADRALASAAGNGSQSKRLANKLLHAPTVRLRRGELSDGEVEDVVAGMEVRPRELCKTL